MAVSNTHDAGRAYWHVMRGRWLMPPLQLHGTTHEIEDPWRIGRCIVIRLLFLPYAIVFGLWGVPRTRLEMLADEEGDFHSRHNPTVEEIREAFIPQGAS